MRDYKNIDMYLNKLLFDIYPQPSGNDMHESLTNKIVFHWMSRLPSCKSVLDVGCGEGIAQPAFESFGVKYEGIALGEDVIEAQHLGRNVKAMDFSFLDYPDSSFDLVFSRHSAEHSFSPLMSFMEWHRVSKQWLGLVVPAAEWYGVSGRNHYYVLFRDQWHNLLESAGWKPIWSEVDELPIDERSPENKKPHEYWIFCERVRK